MRLTPAKILLLLIVASVVLIAWASTSHAESYHDGALNFNGLTNVMLDDGVFRIQPATNTSMYDSLIAQALANMQAKIAALTPAVAQPLVVSNLSSALSATVHFSGINVSPSMAGMAVLLWHLLCRYLIKYPMKGSAGLLAQLVSHCAINGSLEQPEASTGGQTFESVKEDMRTRLLEDIALEKARSERYNATPVPGIPSPAAASNQPSMPASSSIPTGFVKI
jgi:hypothetical protein